MTIEELLSLDITNKNILIIGCPASGKTWLSKKLEKPSHTTIHTDDHACFGYSQGMYSALSETTRSVKPTIVEGVFGYRMLRTGADKGTYFPDVVIELEVTNATMMQTYAKERDPKKIKYLKQFNETHQKILNEYFEMCQDHNFPQWIKYLNNY